jgi:Ser/Thr protein kinase RdoA (MazF antagonist)
LRVSSAPISQETLARDRGGHGGACPEQGYGPALPADKIVAISKPGVGIYQNKPYALFEFLNGQAIELPNLHQWQQLVQKAAELHKLTQGYWSPYRHYRWNYTPELCRELADAAAERINTPSARAKYTWLVRELTTLDLPR